MSAPYSAALLPQHAEMLATSGIPPEHATARGYKSVDERTWFKRNATEVTRAGQNVPGLYVPQLRADGTPWGCQYRPDKPRLRDGKPVKYETPVGQRNGIDVPPGVGPLLGDPSVTLWVTEGVKKADAGAARGLCIVALPGVWSWRGKNAEGGATVIPDWEDIALNGRVVVLAFDSDITTKPQVRAALNRLGAWLTSKGATVKTLNLPDTGDGKTGLDDYLADGREIGDLTGLMSDLAANTPSPKQSAAKRLTDVATQSYDLGVSTEKEPYATPKSGPQTVRMLRGNGGLRAELASTYLDKYGQPPPQQALADAVTALEGLCLRAEPRELHLRVARHGDGSVWLDMGDATGRAIHITPTGWATVETPPVLFQRTVLTAPLAEPTTGGDLNQLWEHVNVAPQDRGMLTAWLIAALIPDVPCPILSLNGEQGSGKSTATRIIGSITDPSTVPLRKAPKDAPGWVTAATGSRVVPVDNLSGIPEWFSDALCRAVTGDGDVQRLLYTNGGLHVVQFRRAVVMNGITMGEVRDDLADRLVTVELHRINEQTRARERDLATAWAAAAGGVLGGLLDLTVKVLDAMPRVHLAKSPRMADYAHILAAVDAVTGSQSLHRYATIRDDLAAETVASDPVLAVLTEAVPGPWEGAMSELLDKVTVTLGDRKPPRGFPTKPREMGNALKRRAPSLRRCGWVVEQTDKRTERGKLWSLAPGKGPDEDLTKPDEDLTNDASSAVRQPFVSHQKRPGPAETPKTGQKPDELTKNPDLSPFVLEEEKEEPVSHVPTREGPESSSVRQVRQETGPGGNPQDPPAKRLIYVVGPGRCTTCGFHTPTQGHRPGCQNQREAS